MRVCEGCGEVKWCQGYDEAPGKCVQKVEEAEGFKKRSATVTATSKQVEDEIQESSEDGSSGAGSSESPRRPGTGPNMLAPSSKPLSNR